MDIVFDQKFAVVGEQLPLSLGFQNVIFVMEDVDAASPIVHSRDRSKRKRGSKTTVEVCVYPPLCAIRLPFVEALTSGEIDLRSGGEGQNSRPLTFYYEAIFLNMPPLTRENPHLPETVTFHPET